MYNIYNVNVLILIQKVCLQFETQSLAEKLEIQRT